MLGNKDSVIQMIFTIFYSPSHIWVTKIFKKLYVIELYCVKYIKYIYCLYKLIFILLKASLKIELGKNL